MESSGVITFNCGAAPVTIVLTSTAKVRNDKGTKLVIDGGNKVTLSGGGKTRILYMATCDKAQVYPPGPGDCNTNSGVHLVVQNITLVDGNAKGIPSWTIINTLLSDNTAVGHGANSGNGSNGGAIYNDGNEIVLNVTSSLIEDNTANEGGSAIFFVSNNKTGSITIKDSLTQHNPRGTFETPNLPGFYVIAKTSAQVINSQILR